MQIVQRFITQNPCYKQGKKITVRGLMLHSVGTAQPSADAFIRQWDNPTYTASAVHAIIDGNSGIIYQTLPWDMRGGHSGGSANDGYIGVEMAEPSSIKYNSTGTAFTVLDAAKAREVVARTYAAAVEVFAHLCSLYGLNPLEGGVIISHSEGAAMGIASGHIDPEHLWTGLGMPYTMDGFRRDVTKQCVKLPPDVGDGFWAADAIRWAIANGIMQGYPDGLFHPDDQLTRAQMATVLLRYHEKFGG